MTVLSNNSFFGQPTFYPYKINQSCRFNDDDSAYLTRTPGSADTNRKEFIFSAWVKRCELGALNYLLGAGVDDDNRTVLFFNASDKLVFYYKSNPTTHANISTDMVFRDPANWYHIVVSVDSSQATGSDRIKIYINGVEVDFTETTGITQDVSFRVGETQEHRIGDNVGSSSYFDGYLAEVRLQIGVSIQQNDSSISDFGQSKDGVWIPKKYTGSYGTNGFYLDFSDSSDLGDDESGNGNDLTASGLTAADQVEDSPTNNYPVLNVLYNDTFGTRSISDGNLLITNAAADYAGIPSTFAIPKSGKWYFEFKNGAADHTTEIDLVYDLGNVSTPAGPTNDPEGYGVRFDTGAANPAIYRNNGSSLGTPSAWTDWGNGEIIAVAVDMDTGKVWYGCDEGGSSIVWDGDPEAGTGNTITLPSINNALEWFIYVSDWSNSDNISVTANFGQSGFTYTPPAGYKALNSKNLPNPANAIKKPYNAFDVVTYTGDGTASRDITDLNFKPDFPWIKNRSQADGHVLYDSVRGATIYLGSHSSNPETTDTNDGLLAFLDNGFTVGWNANDIANANGENYVAWCWKKGPKYGFDIVANSCTGNNETINHNLGGIPELILAKSRDDVENWFVYHHHALNKTDPETDFGKLSTTAVWADDATVWNDTAPTSTQFTVGTAFEPSNYIFYLFRSIEGFSKVFSYEGDGDADGPFIYCGFLPKYILLKDADGTNNWIIYDTERSTYNPVDDYFFPNAIDAESNAGNPYVDFTANGFKIRNTGLSFNVSGDTYVGIAIAEMPFKFSNAR